jgi:REP element-mobilizing transposase RayT
MPDKLINKYRIASARLKDWDYGSNAAYFITICTAKREHFFGGIIDGEMILNDIGQIADECWLAIPDHFPFVNLGNHVIMTNHVHGIIMIEKPNNNGNGLIVETQNFASL